MNELTWIGRVVAERYRLMQVVGRGGHCLVYRAVEKDSGREVAVKVLHFGVARQAELEARMEREFEALTALEGTNAPRVDALLREADGLCIVMELLNGQDLDDYLSDVEEQGNKVDVATVFDILGPVVETLETAHNRGILHRDVKPGNIFVLGRGGPSGVRLLDFGLAWSRSSTRITSDGMVLGSPSYIAPEVWDGQPALLDHRVDVYSLGVIVFRMLAGQVPFPAMSLREKLIAAKTGPRPSLHALRPELPKAVDEWVHQALAIRPEHRFTGVRALWNAFQATLYS